MTMQLPRLCWHGKESALLTGLPLVEKSGQKYILSSTQVCEYESVKMRLHVTTHGTVLHYLVNFLRLGIYVSVSTCQYNVGTYNNQYMVLDLKKIHLKTSIEDDALWIVEQIPRSVHIR